MRIERFSLDWQRGQPRHPFTRVIRIARVHIVRLVLLAALVPLAGVNDTNAAPAGRGVTARAQDLVDCASRIEVVGTTWHLRADCAATAPLVLLDGVTFDGNGHTMWVVDGEMAPFEGNVILGYGGTASVRNVTIDGSNLTQSCEQGQHLQGVRFFDVEGTISHVTVKHLNPDPETMCGHGIVIEGPETIEDGRQVSTTTVEHSTIQQVGGIGIFVWDAVHATITGNVVTGAGNRGIGFLGPAATGAVTENTVGGTGHIGIGIDGSTAVIIAGNAVTDSATAGIVAQNGATKVRIEGNQIKGARFGVIFDQESTSGSATANQVADMVNGGIVASAGAEATVSANHIADVDGNGVASLSGATVTATRNRIYRAERGLLVSEAGSFGDYRDNFISEPMAAGALISEGATATLRRNRFTGDNAGLHVYDLNTTAEISDSAITGVARIGIMVIDQATSVISGNDIRNPGVAGVMVSGVETTATITGNTITRLDAVPADRPTAGIVVVEGAQAEIVDNTISGYVDNGSRDWCGIDVQPGAGDVHMLRNVFPGSDEARNLCFPGSDKLRPLATPD